MSAEQIKKLALKLASGQSFESNWDAGLPRHVSLSLKTGEELVIAQTSTKKYLVSLIDQTPANITSVLTDDFDDSSVERLAHELRSRRFTTSGPSGALHPQLQNTSTNRASELLADSTANSSTDPRYKNDPNAPPGFEDEHRLNEDPLRSLNTQIMFDPDQDLYPPGGRNPRLSPMEPFNPFNSNGPPGSRPNVPFRPGGSGGMHPQPFGSGSDHSFIRYDPTNPF